jgi:hypothetical protein
MWKDPIVEEVRRTRDSYAAELAYDLDAIFADLHEEQERARTEGWEIISMPPRKPDLPKRSAA